MRDMELNPAKCQTWIHQHRGSYHQCQNSKVFGDKCRQHGAPLGKAFKIWELSWNGIKEREFVSQTPHWLIDANGNRTKKVSSYSRFFVTKIEALQHVLDNAKVSVESAERHLSVERDDLAKAQAAYDQELRRG